MEKEQPNSLNPIGIYGWRKRCLYCLILMLLAVVLLNIALTAWILVVLRFNFEGMGSIRITNEGLQVQDTAEFLNSVHIESIVSEDKLQIQSSKNLILEANERSKMEINSDSIVMQSTEFRINLEVDTNAASNNSIGLFGTLDHGIEFQTPSLYVNGSVIDSTITTKQIAVSNDDNGLVLQSSTFELDAEDSVFMNSEHGPINIIARDNITLSSAKITISADAIILTGLPGTIPSNVNEQDSQVVYSLCVCPSGKLYKVLATPDNTNGCATNDADVCSL